MPNHLRRFLAPALVLWLIVTVVTSALIAPARADITAGWSTLWRDDFSGVAGSGLDRSQWLYDLGHGYPGGAWNWGTGEVETMTDSPTNVALDGSGNLAITPVRDSAGAAKSVRADSTRPEVQLPAESRTGVIARFPEPSRTTLAGLSVIVSTSPVPQFQAPPG